MVPMSKISRALGVLVCLGALLLGSACSPDRNGGGEPGQLTVVTSFYPLQFIAERIAGDHANVENLTQPGTEPHDLELTPKQVGSLASADLVAYLSGFQAAVDDAITASGAEDPFDAASVVTLRRNDEGHDHDHEHGDEDHDEDGHDEADHDEEGHDEHDHDHGEFDPHVWLDPTQMVAITEEFAARMVALDPDHTDEYEANRDALVSELTDLDEEYEQGLASCERKEFITSHTAFGYLADRYDLVQIGIAGLSPDTEPSPSRIAEIHEEAKEHQITTIFYETLTSPAVAESIAGDLGLTTDVLDPIEGITAESRGTDYLSVMRSNLEALQTANGCQ